MASRVRIVTYLSHNTPAILKLPLLFSTSLSTVSNAGQPILTRMSVLLDLSCKCTLADGHLRWMPTFYPLLNIATLFSASLRMRVFAVYLRETRVLEKWESHARQISVWWTCNKLVNKLKRDKVEFQIQFDEASTQHLKEYAVFC